MIIAVDFDGVLCDRQGVPRVSDFRNDKPHKYAADTMWKLKERGHRVYILTARKPKDHGGIKWWLENWNFPDMEVTNEKKQGTKIYIDDRAIRFTNWLDVSKYLL